MLTDRERRTLAAIERDLVASDPELAQLFAGIEPRRPSSLPTVLLVVGLVLMVAGSALVVVAVALLGLGIALAALVVAHGRPHGLGRPAAS